MTSHDTGLTNDEAVALIWSNTEKVFSTMLGLSLTASSATEEQIRALRKGGVVSVVGFAGRWRGSGTLRCTGSLACSLSSKLLMTDFDHVNDEVLDAMGEMANMIIGNFKDEAASKLGTLGLSTPTVIYGSNFEARNWNGENSISVLFNCESEVFEVNVTLVPGQVVGETLRPTCMVTAPLWEHKIVDHK
jgi:chemotaxis protein CheX